MHLVVESLRNSSALLYSHVHQFIMRTVVFDSHDDETEVTAFCLVTNSMSTLKLFFVENPMEAVSRVVLSVFKWRKFVDTRFCRIGVSMRAVLASLCCWLDESIQRTIASQHCRDHYLHGWVRLNYELSYYMAVAAVSSWMSEGVLNNIMGGDCLLRNYPDCWKSLLQDVYFVQPVSQFTWARLAALVGGQTAAGMLRSDAVRVAHVCSGFILTRFCGYMKKMSWALCLGDIDSNLVCLEALEGELSKPCRVEDSTVVAGGFQQRQKIKHG